MLDPTLSTRRQTSDLLPTSPELDDGDELNNELNDESEELTLLRQQITSLAQQLEACQQAVQYWRKLAEQEADESDQAEAQLRQQAQFLRTVYDGVEHVIFTWDITAAGELLHAGWNAACEAATGMKASEVIGKSPEAIFGPEQGAQVRQNINRCATEKTSISYEERLTLNQQDTWWFTTLNPIADEHGSVYRVVGTTFNITNLKTTEAALAESETYYRSLIESSSIGLVLCRMDGQFVHINAAFARIVGYTTDELSQLDYWDLTPKYYIEKERQQLDALQQTEQYGPYEKEYIHKAGHYVPVQLSGVLVERNGEQLIWSSVEDISDRKAIEENLRNKENQYRNIFESVSDGICIIDLETSRLITANIAYCEMYGYSLTELLAMPITDIIHPDYHPLFTQSIETTQAGELFFAEAICLHRDGTSFDVEVRATPYWYNGKLSSLVVLRNISDRKRTEADLRQSEELLREQAQREQLLNRLTTQIRNSLNLNEVSATTVRELYRILHLDFTGFAWYYPHLEEPIWEIIQEAKRLDRPSAIGTYSVTLIGPIEDKLLNQEIIQIDDTEQYEEPIHRAFLEQCGVRSRVLAPIQTQREQLGILICDRHYLQAWTDDEIELVQAVADQLAIAIDQAELYSKMTTKSQELEQALAELQRTQAQMIQSEKMSGLGQLVAGVAHEINNPVNFIHGNLTPAQEYTQDLLRLLQLYQTYYPEPVPEIQDEIAAIDLDFLIEDLMKLLSSMRTGTDRIRAIVLSLRNFSRLDEADMKAVDVHEGIDSTLMILQNRLKAKPNQPEIEVVKDYAALPQVECYAGQLNQVFMNILVNAIDALETQTKSIRQSDAAADSTLPPPSIIIRTSQISKDWVEIAIADNGCGMPPAIQQRIFDPFFTTKPVGSGTGMGMSISYQIITERHRGKLDCQSQPGKGTEFFIRIPIRQERAEQSS